MKHFSQDANPWLGAAFRLPTKGDIHAVENPRAVANVVHQTRGEALTPFEDSLADGLMAVFDGGAADLSDVVAGLNARRVPDPFGQAWTSSSLAAQLAELAARAFMPAGEVDRG